MKTCSKCGELNGNGRNDCWKCSTSLKENTYKKICTKCGLLYSHKAEMCEQCSGRLSVYSGDSYYTTSSGSDIGCWMYVVSFFVPIIGIILGCIYIARGEDDEGKSLILFSVFVPIVVFVFFLMFASCMG
ncbi:hypothetical protein RBH29_15805 [Herbivorax sp. ANBcel31]|uniref:hypothetical protein n=1 Tax=Herbivorax sp. ANBcel31 TaxID=3069754 RepID=UPI0027B270D8|nr:hypothetical protein [Herbivorax sp. ANBcel31]MDQ2087896.1 hypothetical protein [Herbivorax sp. ANBcel31]